MASKVTVVGTDLRTATIKVNPGTHLTEVLETACEKLRVSPDNFLLKHKQRQLDLSQTFRTSGLVQGAKLELVTRSKTPNAINVALQFLTTPESGLFPPHGRVTEKLRSDLTIWKVLRQFESGKASAGHNLNITARGVARTSNGTAAGSGQLYYEGPVIQLQNRTLSKFADFQKTLAQLGYNTGSVLMKLSFQSTDTTLADAMADISRYFQQEEEETKPDSTSAPVPDVPTTNSTNTSNEDALSSVPEPAAAALNTIPRDVTQSNSVNQDPKPPASPEAMDTEGVPTSDHRPVTIFSAPTSGTPLAALRPESEEVFVPDISHAMAHQKLLKTAGENKRLRSDQEIEEAKAADAARIAAVKSIKIRVRFPDNFLAEWIFGPEDTGASLHAEVRGIMANDTLPFKLALPPCLLYIKDDDGPSSKLIKAYRLSANTLVNFIWDDKVPADIRKQPFLKDSAAGQAQKVVVPDVPEVEVDASAAQAPQPQISRPKNDGDGSGFKKPKWLKGFGKK